MRGCRGGQQNQRNQDDLERPRVGDERVHVADRENISDSNYSHKVQYSVAAYSIATLMASLQHVRNEVRQILSGAITHLPYKQPPSLNSYGS